MSRTIGVILAGGRSSRMGRDKATVALAGRPLIAHVIDRLLPQVDALAISVSNDPDRFAHLGLPVIKDIIGGFAGPLAGIQAAAIRYAGDRLITVAVDLPLLPRDLVSRLRAGIGKAGCAYATCNGRHAAAILWHAGQAGALEKFLVDGGRRVEDWIATHGAAVEFPVTTDEDVLFNVNTPADLLTGAARLNARGR